MRFAPVFAAVCACQVPTTPRTIQIDMQEAKAQVVRDIARGRQGVAKATDELEADATLLTTNQLPARVRTRLLRMRTAPRGIAELANSPIAFVAALGTDGKIIARDAQEDTMAGSALFATWPELAAADASGQVWNQLRNYPRAEANAAQGADSAPTMFFYAPISKESPLRARIRGVLAGTPLWRTAQRVTLQFHAVHAADLPRGLVFWAYLYQGDTLHERGNASEILHALPSAVERRSRLSASPGGFVTSVHQFGRDYFVAVSPTPSVGPDVGLLLVRADP